MYTVDNIFTMSAIKRTFTLRLFKMRWVKKITQANAAGSDSFEQIANGVQFSSGILLPRLCDMWPQRVNQIEPKELSHSIFRHLSSLTVTASLT